MRLIFLLLTAAVLASCAPKAAPVSWDYYDNAPGGIEVRGPGTYDDLLGEGSSPSVRSGGECAGNAAYELFPPGFGEGGPWIRRCS